MYGTEFNSIKGPFGLKCGQIRGDVIFRNVGWYNKSGERLGWGDLSIEDVEKIVRDIPEGEIFVIMTEQDAYWNLIKTERDLDKPGKDYVLERARLIFARGKFYCPDYKNQYGSDSYEIRGIVFEILRGDRLEKLFE
jgi:hypothetical protein